MQFNFKYLGKNVNNINNTKLKTKIYKPHIYIVIKITKLSRKKILEIILLQEGKKF